MEPRANVGYGVPQDVTFHRLWHTYASLLIEAGLHPKVLQVCVGHASAAETMDTYGHLYPDADVHPRGHRHRVPRCLKCCRKCCLRIKVRALIFQSRYLRVTASISAHFIRTPHLDSTAPPHVTPPCHGRPARPPARHFGAGNTVKSPHDQRHGSSRQDGWPTPALADQATTSASSGTRRCPAHYGRWPRMARCRGSQRLRAWQLMLGPPRGAFREPVHLRRALCAPGISTVVNGSPAVFLVQD
jgi:hypothetical protein